MTACEFFPGDEPQVAFGRVRERFPLGHAFGAVEVSEEQPSDPANRPFGLKYATPVPANGSNAISLSKITYCEAAQMSMIEGQLYLLAGTRLEGQTETERRDDNQVFQDTDVETVDD
ncbi:MAG: hypothetical protein ACRD0K_11070 [Egibacteraceae bacterium]